jgi:hypothetical protein
MRAKRAARALAAACCGLALAAGCRPGGDGATGSGAELHPQLSSIQREVFNPSCALSRCHGGPRPASGLSLEAGLSWKALVDAPSALDARRTLVAPGRPEESYILAKVEGGRIVGGPMPPGRARLSAGEIAAIRGWILRGAPDD